MCVHLFAGHLTNGDESIAPGIITTSGEVSMKSRVVKTLLFAYKEIKKKSDQSLIKSNPEIIK